MTIYYDSCFGGREIVQKFIKDNPHLKCTNKKDSPFFGPGDYPDSTLEINVKKLNTQERSELKKLIKKSLHGKGFSCLIPH